VLGREILEEDTRDISIDSERQVSLVNNFAFVLLWWSRKCASYW